MVSADGSGVTCEDLSELIRSGLTSADGVRPAPAVILGLRPGAEGGREWAALEQLLRLLRLDRNAPVFAGFFRSGGSEAASGRLKGTAHEVCLVPGSDWDWVVWSTTVNELADLYSETVTWPELLLPESGGWILETPPSSNDSFLYPMPH